MEKYAFNCCRSRHFSLLHCVSGQLWASSFRDKPNSAWSCHLLPLTAAFTNIQSCFSTPWNYFVVLHVIKHKANFIITFSPVMHAVWSNKLISLDLIVLIIFGKHYKLHSSSYTFFFKFPVTFVLRSKYHFHHPLLKTPQIYFLPLTQKAMLHKHRRLILH